MSLHVRTRLSNLTVPGFVPRWRRRSLYTTRSDEYDAKLQDELAEGYLRFLQAKDESQRMEGTRLAKRTKKAKVNTNVTASRETYLRVLPFTLVQASLLLTKIYLVLFLLLIRNPWIAYLLVALLWRMIKPCVKVFLSCCLLLGSTRQNQLRLKDIPSFARDATAFDDSKNNQCSDWTRLSIPFVSLFSVP